MSRKLTPGEFDKIQQLVDSATTARTKNEAAPYINQLNSMRSIVGSSLEPYVRIVFGELICSVQSASGQARDKQHWLSFVRQDIYKLEGFVERDLMS